MEESDPQRPGTGNPESPLGTGAGQRPRGPPPALPERRTGLQYRADAACGSWTTRGWFRTSRRGRTFVYTPHYSRERATARFLQQVFDGAIDQVVVSMLSTADPSPEELRQLEKIISEARRRKQRQPKEE